jgi:TRAP-type C4-dicarboxylate transport system substrate-binding protein
MIRIMSRARLSILAFAAVSGTAVVLPLARAATFDVAVFYTEGSERTPAYKFWVKEIEKRTQGRVKFRSFYAGSLVKVNETYKAVRSGTVPIGTTSAAAISGEIPAVSYMEAMAGMPNDAREFTEVAKPMSKLLDQLFTKRGLKFLFMQPSFGTVVVCRNKFLKTPDDWKGLKVRGAGRWQVRQIVALGAGAVALDPAEQYLGLQQGTIDCALSVNWLAHSLKLQEVAPYITELRVPVNVSLYIANKKAWSRISKDDQKIVDQVSEEATRMSADNVEKSTKATQEALKKAGGKLYFLTDAERRQFLDKIRPVFTAMDKSSGPEGKLVRAILEKYW